MFPRLPAAIAIAVCAIAASSVPASRADDATTARVRVEAAPSVTADLAAGGAPIGSCAADCAFVVPHGLVHVRAHGASVPEASSDVVVRGPTEIRIQAGSETKKTVGEVLWVTGILEGVVGVSGALLSQVCRGGDCPSYHSSGVEVAVFGGVAVLGVVSTVVGVLLDASGSTRIESERAGAGRGLRVDAFATRSGGGVGARFAF